MNGPPASRHLARTGVLLACVVAVAAGAPAGRSTAQPAPASLADLATQPGEPKIPNLRIVYRHPLGNPEEARHWKYIIVRQTEGPAGSAYSLAQQQFKNPTKRGVTIWVEIDGTIYWSVAETAIPPHGDGANRNDTKYVD